MKIDKLMPTVTIRNIAVAKEFYLKHFAFKVVFENEWYLSLESDGNIKGEIAFMLPQEEGQPVYTSGGLSICLEVAAVDVEHDRLKAAGLDIIVPLKDNPWGDRSFVTVDPVGVGLYIYSPIEPAAEYKQYMKDC